MNTEWEKEFRSRWVGENGEYLNEPLTDLTMQGIIDDIKNIIAAELTKVREEAEELFVNGGERLSPWWVIEKEKLERLLNSHLATLTEQNHDH